MENKEFKIEKNVPMPKGGKWRTILIELEVGDIIEFDDNIDELESDKFGRLIIPNEEESFFVYDESVGYKILFQ